MKVRVYESESVLFQDHGFIKNLLIRFRLWRAWRRVKYIEVDEHMKKQISNFTQTRRPK